MIAKIKRSQCHLYLTTDLKKRLDLCCGRNDFFFISAEMDAIVQRVLKTLTFNVNTSVDFQCDASNVVIDTGSDSLQ